MVTGGGGGAGGGAGGGGSFESCELGKSHSVTASSAYLSNARDG